jgi:hypothetical protein
VRPRDAFEGSRIDDVVGLTGFVGVDLIEYVPELRFPLVDGDVAMCGVHIEQKVTSETPFAQA